MRFLELHLTAFGHFTDVSLPLRNEKGCLHFVLGRNEAGKSTALRAIRALLYGFPERSRDNFLHSKPRVGATLLLDGDKCLTFQRRKGRKNTFLDSDGAAADEGILRSALAGVSEKQFFQSFGLNHETLRAGGQALLQGRGELGEALFSASASGQIVSRMLTALDAEADALFRAKGKQYPVNRALRSFSEAQRRVRMDAIRKEAYRAQQEALESTRESLAHLTEQNTAHSIRLEQAKRDLTVLPLLRQLGENRKAWEDLRQTLGPAGVLLGDPEAQRAGAEQALERARTRIQDHQRELERIDEALEQLPAGEGITSLPEEIFVDLETRKGIALRDSAELPRQQTEAAALAHEISDDLVTLGRPAGADVMHLSSSAVARIHALGRQEGALRERHDLTQQRVREAKRALEQAAHARDQNAWHDATATELGQISDALKKAERYLQHSTSKDDLSRERKSLSLLLTQQFAALHPFVPEGISVHDDAVAIERLSALPVPDFASIDRFDQTLREAASTIQQHREQLDSAEERRRQRQRDKATVERAGDVPSEERLLRMRHERDGLWAAMRAKELSRSEDHAPSPATKAAGNVTSTDTNLWDRFENAAQGCDQLADRLRREAERVAQYEQIVAEISTLESTVAALEHGLRAATRTLESSQIEWQEFWAASGVNPREPSEMRHWLRRYQALLETVQRLAACIHALEIRQQEEAECVEAIMSTGDTCALRLDLNVSRPTGMAAWIEGARQRVAELESLYQRQRHLLDRQVEVTLQLEVAEQEKRDRELSLQTWRTEWGAAVAPLGLAETALPEEALAMLDGVSAILRKKARLAELQRAIELVEREQDEFETTLTPLEARFGEALEGRSHSERAELLIRRYREALHSNAQRQDLEQQRQARARQLAEEQANAQKAEGALQTMMEEAGVTSLGALRTHHAASRQARLLDEERQQLEAQIRSAADGEQFAVISQRLVNTEAASLRVEKEELASELQQTQARREELQHQLGRLEAGLENQRSRSEAATAAEDAEAALAEVKTYGHRYIVNRVASTMLRREIDRYRIANEVPLLSRANVLFPRLTLGRYRGLRVGFNDRDEPILRCLLHDGREVSVEGLSDGTQDQLYLALRIATLEQRARDAPPLPVTMDDVLVHFDDERAKASFGVLSELAQSHQVLFFTHQARLLELARETIPERLLDVHDLDLLRRTAGDPPELLAPPTAQAPGAP